VNSVEHPANLQHRETPAKAIYGVAIHSYSEKLVLFFKNGTALSGHFKFTISRLPIFAVENLISLQYIYQSPQTLKL